MNIDKKEALSTAIIVSILVYALLAIIVTSEPAMLKKLSAVLGQHPLGMPLKMYILYFIAALCLPLTFFFWHIHVTIRYARKVRDSKIFTGNMGAVFSLISYLKFLLHSEDEPQAIKKSKIYTFIGIVYLIGVAVWWIVWAEIHAV
jgi:Flp pilus assembly protein TadB